MLNLGKIDIPRFISIFIVNDFYCVINCLNMNRVTICRAHCLDIMTLKIFLASCFHYNSEEKSKKLPNPKMKLNKIDTSFPVQVL